MDTSRYRAFLAAAQTGSIKAAAASLSYTPSGVSQLIGALEKELGLSLLFRGKKGVSLTSAGEILLPQVLRLVSQENNLLQIAADLNGSVYGTVNVASYHSIASAWMPRIIEKFQKDFPQVRINLFEGTQMDIMERLKSARIDMAFFNNSAMTGKYDWIPILDDPMMAVLPKNHPLAGEKVFPIEKFSGERFIMPEHGFDYDVVEILSQFNVTPDIYLSTFDSYILLEMVEKGLGISMVNGACLKEGMGLDEVVAIPLDPPRSLEMGIAVMDLQETSPAVRKFIEYSLQVFGKDLYKGDLQ